MPSTQTLNNLQTLQVGSYSEQPEKGKLVLFPSWLEHYVEPNLTNENRISLSFDTKIHV